MIRVPALELESLTSDEHYGIDVLLDHSRLLRVDDPEPPVAELAFVDDGDVSDAVRTIQRAEFVVADGRVRVSRSLLRAVTALAGAGMEQGTTERDRHGRVPSRLNPLVAANCWREPPVSRLAARLRARVGAISGALFRTIAPWPEGHRWAAAITHDLDVVAFWFVFSAMRIAELARRGEWVRARAVAGAAGRALFGSPVSEALGTLIRKEAERRIRTTWFVLAGTPTPGAWLRGDVTYRLESVSVRGLVRRMIAGGHEIGLHGSLATAHSETQAQCEVRRLQRLVDGSLSGGRQHFLGCLPGVTPRNYVAAGLRYDASMGFPDRNGFRLGVADTVPGWEQNGRTVLDIEMVPLTWMDRALTKYARIEDPTAWVADAMEVASVVQECEGLWVGLWHPNLTTPLGFPAAEDEFAGLLDGILARRPYMAPLEELVRWRCARRSIRAAWVSSDGFRLRSAVPWTGSLVLEDRSGHREEHTWPH